MARRARAHFPGALFHVISRGNQRQKLYRDDADYRRFEALPGEIGKRHSLTEAAKYLKRDVSKVSLAVKRLEEEIERDPKLRQRMATISDRLWGRDPDNIKEAKPDTGF